MVNRQESINRKLIGGARHGQPFDHGVTALMLIVFGVFFIGFGSAMTGFAFGYETYPRVTARGRTDRTTLVTVVTTIAYKQKNFVLNQLNCITQQAMSYGLRCDIAGPLMLSLGVVKLMIALILISGFGVCTPPDRTSHKISPEESVSPLDGISIVETRFRNNH